MIQTIVFSKNRAAQLDQLLQSIARRAPDAFDPINVLWTANSADYMRGYRLCIERHPNAAFNYEHSFAAQLTETLHKSQRDYVMFLCDDDLVTKPFVPDPTPWFLLSTKQILTVSLRLGLNTTDCYPLNRPQQNPNFTFAVRDARVWNWKSADGDWGYPGSLDGHVFRKGDLLSMLSNTDYTGPNRLEELLMHRCERQEMNMMACYSESVITGCPLNLVNTTHSRNRNAGQDPLVANTTYLEGKRPMLYPIERNAVTAAHVELPLVFV